MKNKIKYLYIGLIIVLIIGLGIWLYFRYSNNEIVNIDKLVSDKEVSVIDEDSDINWDNMNKEDITLNDKSVTISNGGVYTISGKISNGSITVNTSDNVKLILNNVEITNNSGPAIIILSAKNTVIELADNSVNSLTDGSNYSNQEYDGCIYSKDDLILQGNGKLIVNAKYSDGIVSNDDLKIVSGTYEITSTDDGIRGKDSVYIVDGTITINAKGDGIKATNDTETEKGNIRIDNGTIKITSDGDGMQAENKLVINNGVFDITTNGNSDDVSCKGIKAINSILIANGTFNINSEDDGIHSDNYIEINDGKITIKSNDDAIHADGMILINNGTINTNAHEGLEATYVKINDGVININASDDGINAGKKSNEYAPTVEINGGKITIKMANGDTDGIDSNGNIYINGGTIDITCNSPFDYDGEAKNNGGTIIVNGEETNTITNQMMGGGMPSGNRGGEMPRNNQGDMQRGGQERMPGKRNRDA